MTNAFSELPERTEPNLVDSSLRHFEDEDPLAKTSRRPLAIRVGAGLKVAGLVGCSAVAPLLPTIDQKVDATLASLLILGLGSYVTARNSAGWRGSCLDLPLIAFLAAAILATVLSPDPFVSFFPSRGRGEGLLMVTAFLAFALTAARLDSPHLRLVLHGVFISAAVISMVAIGQFYGWDLVRALGYGPVAPGRFFGVPTVDGDWFLSFGGRGHATLGNPVFLGGYVVLLLPLVTAIAIGTVGHGRWIFGSLAVVLAAALISSGTRAAWVSFCSAYLVLVGLPPTSPRPWRALITFALIFAVLWFLMAATNPALRQRAATTFDTGDASLRMKLYVWKHVLPMIIQRPLTGWGFSNLLGRFPDIGSEEYREIYGWQAAVIDSPHNDLLHVAFATGLVGLGAYLWVWATVFRVLGRVRGWLTIRPLAVGAAASLVGYWIWLQSAWNHLGPANVFWPFVGLCVAMDRGARKSVVGRCRPFAG